MLKLGCAKANVVPDFPTFMRGYGSRNQFQNGVEEPIELGVLALEQKGVKTLIVTADCEGIRIEYCRKICNALEKAFGIGYPNVYIASSHTHFGPGFSGYQVTFPGGKIPLGDYPDDRRYFDFWLKKALGAAEKALATMEECTLEEATLPIDSVAFNRRTVRKDNGKVDTNYIYPQHPELYDFSPIDHDFSVWRFMVHSRPKAILGCFACHPVTGGSKDSYYISADYPGYFQQKVQEYFNCPGFFMLGAAGDVVPMRRNGESRRDIGEILARSIRLNELRFRSAPHFKPATAVCEVPVKIAARYRRETAENDWAVELAAARETSEPQEALARAAYPLAICRRFPTDEFTLPIQLLRLGSRVLVGIPYEVLSVIALRLKAACPEAVLTSITGGYEEYLPLAEDFPRGGYEVDWGAAYAPDNGDNFLAAAIAAVKNFR